MGTALIIGASRGIGHELVRQYRADGWRVLATHRKLNDAKALRELGAEAIRLDVTDAAASVALADSLRAGELDVVVINAGIFPTGDSDPAALDEASFLDGMRTNVLAPLRLAGLLGSKVKAGGVMGFMSTSMASLGQLQMSNAPFYRCSKTALNMVVRQQTLILRDSGVFTVALDPGWVQTDMGGADADIDVATSVDGLRRVIASIDAASSGSYFAYNGKQHSW
ncbi:SDR family NAD(P)-dependent oxidoreductase [Chitinimonas sp.]|uniref:SDR family NAD(P)-dependent oxidoreductase n=1 Tax=Chitinimonas sp. TaxID=1934313 RepID=UPI0035AF2B35